MGDVKSGADRRKPTRREQAAQTRRKIVVAALQEFVESGWSGTRMADIADRAGVAVQTVYFSFHTKAELLSACYEHAVLGPDRIPPNQQLFWSEAVAARSGRSALAAFARGNTAIIARAAAIDEVARAASHEPEPAEVRRSSEELRRSGYRELLGRVSERFGFRPGLDLDRATDIALVLAGPAAWLAFEAVGWTAGEYADWLGDTLATQLLARPGPRS